MKIKFINPHNFTLVMNLAETEKQGKEIYEFTNAISDPFHVMIDGIAYYPDRHYLSDLSSIPKLLTVIKGFERYRWKRSALIHDQLYRLKYLYRRNGTMVLFDREDADKIYKLLIIEEGKLTHTILLANIVAPSAGETILNGTTYDIVWKQAGNRDYVVLGYITPDDVSVPLVTISNVLNGINTYTWEVSGLPATNQLKITLQSCVDTLTNSLVGYSGVVQTL